MRAHSDRGRAVELIERSRRAGAEDPTAPAAIRAWLSERAERASVRVDRTPLDALDGWSADPDTGDLRHRSGRFFSVRGLDVRRTEGQGEGWSQPIIDQPEVGVLGFLVKEFDGVPHLLLQAKMEPGNVNGFQLSPTVQATRSNYTGVHRGRAVPYLEHFLSPEPERVLADSLQSEQGSWFLRKRNRNMVVLAPDGPIPVLEGFHWATLGQVHALLAEDDTVNMDTRTVLAGLPFHAGDPDEGARHSTTEVLSRLASARSRTDMTAVCAPLASIEGWKHTSEGEIVHESGRFFRVVGVDVTTSGREVGGWSQPMIAPSGTALTALVVREFEGVPHVLLNARAQAGLREIVELGPTVQCVPEDLADGAGPLPRLFEEVMGAEPERVLFDAVQSEEGGRFHHARTRNLIVDLSGRPLPKESPDDVWLAPAQVDALLRHGYYLSIEARSLIACLRSRV
ncbi:NDP-hexose 2,3-dehydratase family protein [Nocardiopsis alba]|jgi:oxidase EvaA|uniref:NDP-hexose 2,3-dehydratase family protein n=1 Tax=Nocardiopsis alba TaxID=53437 RepID=UPI0033EA0E15